MNTPKIVYDELTDSKVVMIPEVIFKNKQKINWNDVEVYLEKYIGKIVEVAETKDIIYLGKNFPSEYAGSQYTAKLKGARAKTKANAAQGILQMIEIAYDKLFKENQKEKHKDDAKKGWYYYRTRFAIPIYENEQKSDIYNIYSACFVINCVASGKKYLYDLVDIKREASTPLKTNK